MPYTLYFASGNAGKLRDFAAAAEVFHVAVLPLPGLKDIPAPEETGATFEENAALKAIYYSRFLPDQLVIADDSGLEVDALDGAPGVRSARYADDAAFEAPGTADERNNLYLLQQLASRKLQTSTARYRCVIALARNGEVLLSADGSVEGEILPSPRGTGGFGYDPVFYLPYLGKTMAEIDLAQKQHLSHRGNALLQLLQKLNESPQLR
ncbi:MAG TPA: RdgB/HAM1 family non-canonical purine NTP pyrophosphatase [Alloacidobacterium sp.]|jgi:XTP/dITP diphosphohydrolase|nr:RdgB/HAM1 family non-canonical purine NTP pyrophosphatase [Alloacidobacterium sp.]